MTKKYKELWGAATVQNFLNHIWYRQHGLSYLLAPVSWIYQLIIFVRRCCYRWGIKKSTVFSVPIVVVGNITVGGTGKTPLVAWLVQQFKQNDYKPGIISRGYGGQKHRDPQIVTSESDPKQVGDEPVMLARQTCCPVLVSPDRVAAAKKLLSSYDCNVIVSDDGMQHYALARDIEIAVIDELRRFGNGFCLPAGPLRETKDRLNSVDFVVKQSDCVTSDRGFFMHLHPGEIYSLVNPRQIITIAELNKKTIHAVAGIGYPQRFFDTLTQCGLQFIPHVFPDHYNYCVQDIDFDEDAWVLMTEKDAVKCQSFADHRHWCMPVSATVSGNLDKVLLTRVQTCKF